MSTIMTPPGTTWAKHRLVNPNAYAKYDAELIVDAKTAGTIVAGMQAELSNAVACVSFPWGAQLTDMTLPLRRCDLADFTASGGAVYASSCLKPPVYDTAGKQLTDEEVAAIPAGASGRTLLDVTTYEYQGSYGVRLELVALQYLSIMGSPQACPFPTTSSEIPPPSANAPSEYAECSVADLDNLLI